MSTVVPAKRGQYLWIATANSLTPFVIVDVIAWEIGEIGASDRPTPITPTGRVDPMMTRCVLATNVGWHALRENVVFRISTEAVEYLRQAAA